MISIDDLLGRRGEHQAADLAVVEPDALARLDMTRRLPSSEQGMRAGRPLDPGIAHGRPTGDALAGQHEQVATASSMRRDHLGQAPMTPSARTSPSRTSRSRRPADIGGLERVGQPRAADAPRRPGSVRFARVSSNVDDVAGGQARGHARGRPAGWRSPAPAPPVVRASARLRPARPPGRGGRAAAGS